MAQSVSNEALWVKLSEMDKKLDNISAEQQTSVSIQETEGNKPDFTAVKNGIISKIKTEISILGASSDSHFEATGKNIQLLNDNILKVLNVVSRIRKQQRESAESRGKEKEACFNFRFFKVRKSSFVIAILRLLVFILTLFCMKQQNDYSLLLNEYYKQNVVIDGLDAKTDSLKLH